MTLPFTITNESITVVYEGKPHTVGKAAPNYAALRSAVLDERWDDVPGSLTVVKALASWATGDFTCRGSTFIYRGTPVPDEFNLRIVEMASKNCSPEPLFNFWERLSKNPSYRSVAQLWRFLANSGIPLTPDGHFLAYKGVTNELLDAHTRTFDNSPGSVNKLPRNQVSDDPKTACHEGFHVGALSYAKTFSARVVICEVDPEHVVCVPYDCDSQKMRVCEYTVIGFYSGDSLPSTVVEVAQLPVEEAEKPYNVDDDFLAEPCDECELRIPGHMSAVNNSYHQTTCSLYDAKNPPPEAPEDREETGTALTMEAPAPEGTKPAKPVVKPAKVRKLPKRFAKYLTMDMTALLQVSIGDLRDYATNGLQLVGASKIPGGKVALIAAIDKLHAEHAAHTPITEPSTFSA